MIQRKKYLLAFEKYIDAPLIKVITGMRRSGKTVFLRQVMEYLRENRSVKESNIIALDKEDYAFTDIQDARSLAAYITAREPESTDTKFLFIDEVQDIDGWEKVVKSYGQKPDWNIFITGSNSNLLSGELASHLTGRFVEFHLYPLGFQEFLEFRGEKQQGVEQEFRNYLRYGGLPAIHAMEFSDEMIGSYLSSVFDSILLRDIVQRYQVRQVAVLKSVLAFLADNIGNIVSTKKIADFFRNEHIPLSLDTLREYLEYFKNTFLFTPVKRYDLKGKRILRLYEKYYAEDIGIRNSLFRFAERDIGRTLENIVYIDLKRRGYTVSIGKTGDLEIDFIAEKGDQKAYYQVAYLLADEKTTAREFGVFDKVRDNYPKYVLSLDTFWGDEKNGIARKNIIDWLLEK